MSKVNYSSLAKEAIATLKERTGSSLQAIKAYVSSKHPTFQAVCSLLISILFSTL
jgi:uncharacterized protein YvpB